MRIGDDDKRLHDHIIHPLAVVLGAPLEACWYYDAIGQVDLITNHHDVDIIAHQLELNFGARGSVFVSWATVAGWAQYSLCAANRPFCDGVERYHRESDQWRALLGKRLERIEIFGYEAHRITTTGLVTGSTSDQTFFREPHLLLLHFEGGHCIGVANFYQEADFIPKFPTGDDIWIAFGAAAENYQSSLSLELLESLSIS